MTGPKIPQAVLFAALIAVCSGATAAFAELGGGAETIDVDRAHFSAKMSSSIAPDHMTYTLLPNYGGTVHEFANANGMVFAISWHSPGRPDLRQLLGTHFGAFNSDLAARTGRRMSRQVITRRSDIVVQTAGHPGAFFGIAYLPSLLPQGTSINDLP